MKRRRHTEADASEEGGQVKSSAAILGRGYSECVTTGVEYERKRKAAWSPVYPTGKGQSVPTAILPCVEQHHLVDDTSGLFSYYLETPLPLSGALRRSVPRKRGSTPWLRLRRPSATS